MRYSDGLDVGPASGSRNRSRQAGSVMVMFTLLLPFVLIPLVGLAIDTTMMYSVKAKLQAAVDGGAIAAAQSLKSGINFAAQKTTAEKTADQFIKANFVVDGAITGYHGYWGAYNLNDTTCGASPCIVAAEDNFNKRRTVSVTASVQVPLLFMRILGFSTGTVTAKGTAARRDVVMVLVLDRSSSMGPAIAALRDGATYFVNQFQAGRDRLGLVVFGGSAIVAYPSADWKVAPTGPDTAFKDADTALAPNMLTSISNVAIASNTGTAEALMLAWKELQAANQPGALNVIVLFTDGQPNGITANFNDKTGSGGTGVIKHPGTSTCTNWTDGGVATKSMIGWMAQWGGFKVGTTAEGHGIFTRMQSDHVTQTTVTGWLKTGTEPTIASPPSLGCAYALPNSAGPPPTTHTENVSSDLTIPAQDFWGNPTNGTNTGSYTTHDYQQSEIWNNAGECNKAIQDLTKPGDACQVGLASWNAADMAGMNIRNDAVLTPVIYTLGYLGNGGDDPALMRRLSNIKGASSVYDSTKPEGLYLQIATVDDITPAFQKVLSEILRLTL
jgi:Flp pilus assembly protein TadG